MQKIAFFTLAFFLFSVESFAYRPGTKDTSIYNECRWNKEALGYAGIECNDLYNLYPSKEKSESYKDHEGKVRLGSYNILWSEDEETDKKSGKPKKSYELNVKMINDQWDVVALQELQYGSNDGIKSKEKPQYIEMLEMLQEKDPSWGLIISPFGQSSKRELLGFYYRGSVAQPVESKYCKKNFLDKQPYYIRKDGFIYREVTEEGAQAKASRPINTRDFKSPSQALACPLAFSQVVAENFPKIPFMARFQSGIFEFSYVSLHLGFRGLEEFDSDCMGVCQMRNLKLISFMDGDEDNKISRQIDELVAEESTQKIFLGTEVKLKDPKDVKDTGYHSNLSKSLFTIYSNEQLPTSCLPSRNNKCDQESMNSSEYKSCAKDSMEFAASYLISNIKAYTQCFQDFESQRKKTYKGLAAKVFDEIIFNENIKRLKKSSGETKEDFVTRAFKDGSIVSGLYNVLGQDKVISKASEGREFPRLFQVNSVLIEAQKMKDTEDSNDVIVAGDFNLEVEDNPERWHYHVWEKALSRFEGAELLIQGPSSLNDEQDRVNNYDHFIMSPKATNECDSKSAEIFNFLTAILNSGEDLGAMVKDKDYHFVMSDHLPIGMTCSAD